MLLCLLQPSIAAALEPEDNIVRALVTDEMVTHVELHGLDGLIAWTESDVECGTPCIVRFELELPAGYIWAVAVSPQGRSAPSNVLPTDAYPTVYELADTNGDEIVDVRDIVEFGDAMYSGSSFADANLDGRADVHDLLLINQMLWSTHD
jgi:hypothetical protein